MQDKFISTFGLEKEVKSQLKFYLNGKEIMKNDNLINILKPDNIIEVKNINEVKKIEEESKVDEKEKKDDKEKNEENIKTN